MRGTVGGVGEIEPGDGPDGMVEGFPASVWQAEGVLMELLGVGPQRAGQELRRFARENGQTLIETSATIVGTAGQ